MKKEVSKTEYASSERASRIELIKQNLLLKNSDLLISVGNSVLQMLVILNKQRQIVYANKIFMDLIALPNDESYFGKRTGELLSCAHSELTAGGCGTTKFCSTCGAVNSILESQTGVESVKETRFLTKNQDALDLLVKATPYTTGGQEFTFFVISDISNKKRRQVLERVFFHDVLNSAGGISGLSGILNEIEEQEERMKVADMIHQASNNLISEIVLQKEISAAENGDLELKIVEVNSQSILQQVADLYSKHEITAGKFIEIDANSENFSFKTDPLLLRRIIGNMTKNALEASLPDSTVTLSASKTDNIQFSVHNNSYIEKRAQLQLFKRSFSTKGTGRGMGTYSMKLFGEKYLKGKVGFISNEAKGTTFYVQLP